MTLKTIYWPKLDEDHSCRLALAFRYEIHVGRFWFSEEKLIRSAHLYVGWMPALICNTHYLLLLTAKPGFWLDIINTSLMAHSAFNRKANSSSPVGAKIRKIRRLDICFICKIFSLHSKSKLVSLEVRELFTPMENSILFCLIPLSNECML